MQLNSNNKLSKLSNSLKITKNQYNLKSKSIKKRTNIASNSDASKRAGKNRKPDVVAGAAAAGPPVS
jgi:hypothetical protein